MGKGHYHWYDVMVQSKRQLEPRKEGQHQSDDSETDNDVRSCIDHVPSKIHAFGLYIASITTSVVIDPYHFVITDSVKRLSQTTERPLVESEVFKDSNPKPHSNKVHMTLKERL